MAASTILFFDDLLHRSNAEVVLSASGTASGYDINNVRDSNLLTAWKDSDSTTANISITVDGGTTTWLGAATDTAYVAIAYDTRLNDQDTLKLEYGTVDDGAFATPNVAATFTLTKLGTDVACQYKSFSIPSTAKRYWRLIGYGNERTETTGSQVPKVYAFSMFDKDSVVTLGSGSYAADALAAHQQHVISRASVARTAAGALATNQHAKHGQRFETNFDPASITLWQKIRDEFAAQGGPARANFVQFEGLKNVDTANFFLCRGLSGEFQGARTYLDQYPSGLTWETEVWF